jgi:hypothetical protein
VATDQELQDIRSENDKKRKEIEEQNRKAARLQSMVENDTTKASLLKESANLDIELQRAKDAVKTLELVSGVSADSITLPTMRGVALESAVESSDTSGDTVIQSSKRVQK